MKSVRLSQQKICWIIILTTNSKQMTRYKILSLFFILLFFQSKIKATVTDSIACEHWGDSVMKKMTLDEKIGQLFMYNVSATDNANNQKLLLQAVKENKAGGVLFWRGTIKEQAALTNLAQEAAEIPLFIALDGEYGLNMRLSDALRYPRKTTLSAIQDEQLIYDLGVEIGRQCNELGIHIDFDPVLDLPNPVIDTRSFGDDPKEIARKATLFTTGLKTKSVIAVGKHFPGHGSTQQDSHKELAVVMHDRAQLDSIDLYPFTYLFNNGMDGVMVGHLAVPAIDPTHTSATLSYPITTQLLQEELGFRGLIISDGMRMKAVASIPDLSVKALLAGNDIILDVANLTNEIQSIKTAIKKRKLSKTLIDERVSKILRYKYMCGLFAKPSPINLDSIEQRINTKEALVLQEKLAKQSITLVKNEKNIIPLKSIENKIALVNIGESSNSGEFVRSLSQYDSIRVYNVSYPANQDVISSINKELDNYNPVIFAIYESQFPDSTLTALSEGRNAVQAYFISPYKLTNFKNSVASSTACILAYESSMFMQKPCAQAIFGGISITGKLPIALPELFSKETFISLKKSRLAYSFPEMEQMNSSVLQRIDSIAIDAIAQGAMPGCQILVARRGTIVYQKSFGHHEYDKQTEVKNTDLYDLASITKVAATLPMVMKLYDQEKIELDEPVSSYFSEFRHKDKKDINFRSLLLHQSGYPAFVPFYCDAIDMKSVNNKLKSAKKDSIYAIQIDKNTFVNKNFQYKKGLITIAPDEEHTLQVADSMFILAEFKQSICDKVRKTPVAKEKKYIYSDLNLILLQELSELVAEQNLEDFTSDLYKNLGVKSLGFNPRNRFEKASIVPTEQDNFLRKQLLQGYVHDENAAFIGGVAGHAGLFGNAGDLAVYFQMLLNGGTYAGKQYFTPATCALFTNYKTEIGNRGLGFDRREVAQTTTQRGRSMFGHTGFTGTCAWVDPKEEIIYIFLSNRINPVAWNRKLQEMNIRNKIEEVIYQSIEN
jgi:beta-glucosidase-like glycosyl hydrolase/CubicO group peptidase (beta-lactamase class C family)